MSDKNESKATRAPKLAIDQERAEEPETQAAPESTRDDTAADVKEELHEAVGFLKGVGVAAWRYAVKHPHTACGAVLGFIVAVLILTVGLWSTIVIGIFVFIGALIGQIRDGDNGIVNFFGRLFSGRH